MTEKLKPCPFCGKRDLSPVTDDGLAWVRCEDCGATGPETTRYDEDDAPDWNTRPVAGEPVGVVGSMPGTSGFTMASFEAAKVPVGTPLYTRPSPDREVVDEDAIILSMCKAHDREEAAQMGEPSPWREDFDRDLDWEQGRLLAMREAFDVARAILSASTVEG